MTAAVRATAAACVLAAVAGLTACSSDDAGDGRDGTRSASSVAGSTVARWWSNDAARKGSTIDPADPEAAARKLRPSRTQYCGMLRQTVRSGHKVLPGVTAADPALLTASKAFVAEMRAVAPASVTSSWETLGDAVLKLAASKGDARKVKGIDATALRRASAVIGTDAKRACRLDISR